MEFQLEQNQIAEPIDDATRAALDEARAQAARGEVVTLEQSNINLRKRLKAWRQVQQEVLVV